MATISSEFSKVLNKAMTGKFCDELGKEFDLDTDKVKEFMSKYLSTQFTKGKKNKSAGTGRTSGFIMFSNEYRQAERARLEKAGEFDGVDNRGRMGKIGKALGAKWKSLSEAEKEKWKNKAKAVSSAAAAASSEAKESDSKDSKKKAPAGKKPAAAAPKKEASDKKPAAPKKEADKKVAPAAKKPAAKAAAKPAKKPAAKESDASDSGSDSE